MLMSMPLRFLRSSAAGRRFAAPAVGGASLLPKWSESWPSSTQHPFVNSTASFSTETKKKKKKMTLEQLAEKVDLTNQKVLVRVDLNVPLDKDNRVTDDTRLRAILPTVQYLLDRQAAVILCSHFGRPKGEIIETGKNGRLTPVVAPLQQLLGGRSVTKLNDCVGAEVEQFVQNELRGGQVCLLENTRFHAGETKNDAALSAGLGRLADYYCLDAFGTAHRAHASTVGVAAHVKYAVAGFLLEKELDFLQGAIFDHPALPLVAIVGGAKVSTKIPVIRSLCTAEHPAKSILIGGGMIFTFYKALGYNIGKSLVEDDMIPVAKEILQLAAERGVQLVLPKDVVVADALDNSANTAIAEMTADSNGIADDAWMGLDIGPATIQQFRHILETDAATVVWNGPMGVFELSNFAAGTNAIADILAHVTKEKGVVSIVGGGDSVAAIQQAGLGDAISHISTGGGASLELLEGKVLPGIAALSDAE